MWTETLTMPKSLAASVPSWVWGISGFLRDLDPSKACRGKVGSAHEHFYDEM